jgi:hypothetical protein
VTKLGFPAPGVRGSFRHAIPFLDCAFASGASAHVHHGVNPCPSERSHGITVLDRDDIRTGPQAPAHAVGSAIDRGSAPSGGTLQTGAAPWAASCEAGTSPQIDGW